ncbi:hypothetical protein hrd7_33700 (plasmid) [Leptolinea sp. HRD-7]|nr:hypothetical protein hrd7_33700 [Leptolinea sp. HRD-7]
MNTAHTRKFFAIVTTAVILIGMGSAFNPLPPVPLTVAAARQDASTPTPTGEAEVTRFFADFDDVSFYYTSTLSSKVTARKVEAAADVNNPATPRMDVFEFDNYPVISRVKPRINVFAVQEIKDLGGVTAVKQLQNLDNLIGTQVPNPPGAYPALLTEPSTQLMRAGLRYVNFQNGSGIRYLSEYGEQPWPLDNTVLFYTYQGITGDGAYYVSAVLPVTHPGLEGDDGFTKLSEDPAKFQSNYPAYVDYVQKQLNTEPPNAFTPNLASLDAMMKSLSIGKATPSPAKPTAVPTMTITNSPSGCTNEASFVADVTVPDDTSFPPGANFTKTWRLKNVGTCTWTPKYKLVFQSGDAMGAPAAVTLTNANVPPNSNLNVSVKLTSPQDQGTYQGFFKMRAPDGTVFGIAPNGSNPFWVLINVVPPSVDTPTVVPGVTLIPIVPKLTLVVPPVLIPPSP